MKRGLLKMAILSILGLYRYNPQVFNGFRTPENVDKQTVIDSILLECAELEIIYSDWDYMQFAIETWTKKEFPIWEELQKTREYEYNPIWNKDGVITETEKRSNEFEGSANGENIRSVKGFNSDSWAESQKDKGNSGSQGQEEESIERQRLEQGNIGVTTTQKMIQEQREVVAFNTIDYIVESFKKRFCILVY